MMNKFLLAALITSWLTGCGSLVKSDYQRPVLSVPAAWRIKDSGPDYLLQSRHWWDNFGDPQLSALIEQVLNVNNDLALAGLQLQQARLAAGLADTNLTPEVSLTGSASNTKNLREQTRAIEAYSTSLNLSYELDLWGKLARAREKARWQAEASFQDRQNVALTLIGDTAHYYWQIGNLNQKIVLQQEALQLSIKTRELVQSRYAAGQAGEIDLLQAGQSVLNLENGLYSLRQQRDEARNALTILFNRPPVDRLAEPVFLNTSQEVPIASRLPAAVIAQRPDVQAAEATLRATLAAADVERASFYPDLSLTASLSAGHAVFQQWFSNPVRTLGSGITLPFIQWNRMQLTVKSAGLDVQQAAITFRNTVYKALADVDNAMAQRLYYQQQRQTLQHNVTLSQRRLQLATSQYGAGAISLESLLDAETALVSARTSLSDMQYNYLYATMKLWLALGGGMEKNNREVIYG